MTDRTFLKRGARIAMLAGTSAVATMVASTSAYAQLAPAAPTRNSIDEYGVDVFDGTISVDAPQMAIGGGDNGLGYHRWNRGSGWSDSATAFMKLSGTVMTVSIGKASETFNQSGSTYTSTEGSGSTLTFNSTSGIYTYTRSDGTIARFDKVNVNEWNAYGNSGLVTEVVAPDGEKISYSYTALEYCGSYKPSGGGYLCTRLANAYRLASVTSSYGYQIKPTYAAYEYFYDDTVPENQPDFVLWSTPTGINAHNLAVSTSTVQTNQTFGTTTGGGNTYMTVTDALSAQTSYRMSGARVLGITRPGSSSEDVTFTYTYSPSVTVTGVTVAGIGTTTYARSDAGNVRTVTVTDPLTHASTYIFDIPSRRLTSFTNALSQTTSYLYDSTGRVTRVTKPEGNYVQYTYDARGNVTETRSVAKTAGTPADVVVTAGFAASCSNPVTCNQPNWTKDALGNQTDYTYDATHGGVLTVTQPAATTGGTRPQTRYSYTSLQAYYNKGSGIVASGVTTYRLTGTSTCLESATCANAAEEAKVAISYGPQTNGTGNNLMPVSVTRSSGDNSITATTTLAYDALGNVTSVDGPLAGTADTTVYWYDAGRKLVGVVTPDPDGAGTRKPIAVRYTYNSAGLTTMTEKGTVNFQTSGAWANFASYMQSNTVYDASSRPVQQTMTAGGTTYAMTQLNYDGEGRVNCVVTRMDPVQWGSQTSASACTPQTTGSSGPDRVTKYTYDNLDRVTLVRTAFGTTAQANEVAGGYTSNGLADHVIDGGNNRTTYEYDGHDRLVKTRYPVATKGANSSSTTDYEQLTYGDNVHVTQRRLRDGSTIGFAYDKLDRVTGVTPSGETAFAYTYDLLGHVLTAQRGTLLTNSWDALGRRTFEGQSFGSMAYQFDAAGRPTRLTWSDGFYVDYDYDQIGNVTAIRENGATTGIGVLAQYTYDVLGLRSGITYGNATSRSYAHGPLQRLLGIKINPVGTTNDLVIGKVGTTGTDIAYTPSSQIASIERSNDAYAWSGHYNFNRNYTTNGLNQYTASGATSLGYDARGNLTSSGSTTYSYSKLNELTAVSNGTTLYYDAESRLHEYDTSVSRRFFYAGSSMVAEVANPTGAILRRFVPGPGTDEPIVWYEGSGTTDRRWLQADERGSIVSVTDASGASIGINAYDEYGIPQSGNIGRFQYTGQVWLPEAGLYYYKARMYSPTLGRFMQTDPIGYGDGMNWYNYVGGDPVNRIDPSGLEIVVSACPAGWSCIRDPVEIAAFLELNRDMVDSPTDAVDITPIVVEGEPEEDESESDFDFWDCAGSVALGGALGAIDPVATVINAGREIANGMNRSRPADARFLSPEEKMSPNGQGRLTRSFGAAVRIGGRQLIASNPWVRAGGALIGGGVALLTNPSCGIGIGIQNPNAPIL